MVAYTRICAHIRVYVRIYAYRRPYTRIGAHIRRNQGGVSEGGVSEGEGGAEEEKYYLTAAGQELIKRRITLPNWSPCRIN